jgi:hypothetical protein
MATHDDDDEEEFAFFVESIRDLLFGIFAMAVVVLVIAAVNEYQPEVSAGLRWLGTEAMEVINSS